LPPRKNEQKGGCSGGAVGSREANLLKSIEGVAANKKKVILFGGILAKSFKFWLVRETRNEGLRGQQQRG